MTRSWGLLWLTVALGLGTPGFAADQEEQPVEPRGSFECRDTPLRSALDLLARQSGLAIRVQPDVADVRVTLTLRDVPYADILRVLVRQAANSTPGLRVVRRDGAWLVRAVRNTIGNDTQPAGPEPLESPALMPQLLRKISVGFNGEGMREVLGRVFALAGAPHYVEPNVPNVPITLSVRSATLWECVRRVLASAPSPIALGQLGEVYVIALQQTPIGSQANPPPGRITLRLMQVPLKLAAEALFNGTGYRYELTPDPGATLIDLDLRDVPLDVALGRLAQEASRVGVRLTWTRG